MRRSFKQWRLWKTSSWTRYLSVVPGMAMVGSASCWASALEMAEMPTVRERVLVLVFFVECTHTHTRRFLMLDLQS